MVYWTHLLKQSFGQQVVPRTQAQAMVMAEFEHNGITFDLDELDILQMNTREKNVRMKESDTLDLKSNTASEDFLRSLEYIRCKIAKLRPLPGKKCCVFCKNNKELEGIYTTHVVKDTADNVVCPILSRYTCPLCFATGTKAHTIKYCPYNDGIGTLDALLMSSHNCAGKRRQNSAPSSSTTRLAAQPREQLSPVKMQNSHSQFPVCSSNHFQFRKITRHSEAQTSFSLEQSPISVQISGLFSQLFGKE